MARPRPDDFNEPQRVRPAARLGDRRMAGDPFSQRGIHLRGDSFRSRSRGHVPADTAVASQMTESASLHLTTRQFEGASMQRRYVTVDVFTDRMFGGNPVAVVFDADGLSASQMQAIAVEFNYSETTFVLRASQPDHAAWVRILTPNSEIPFAGHPNVGTAFALAARMGEGGEAIPDHFVFEEEAGLVPVSLIRENGRSSVPNCARRSHYRAVGRCRPKMPQPACPSTLGTSGPISTN